MTATAERQRTHIVRGLETSYVSASLDVGTSRYILNTSLKVRNR